MKYIFNSPCSPVQLMSSHGTYLFENGDECFDMELVRKFPQLFKMVGTKPIPSTKQLLVEQPLPVETIIEEVPVKRKAGRPKKIKD